MKIKGILSSVLVLLCFNWFVLYSGVVSAAQKEVDWGQLLAASGVSEVLDQANILIEQELKNLERAPVELSSQEMSKVMGQFHKQLNSDKLKKDVIVQLQQSLSQDNVQQVQNLLQSPELQQILLVQSSVNSKKIRKSMRNYLIKMKKKPLNIKRLELVSGLDESLQQSALESELKVELRKQLLATVTQLKVNDTISEDMLDQELTGYRERVEKDTSQNAKNAYLFLLKNTPSKDIKVLHEELSHPAFYHFMAVCVQAVRESFHAARQDFRASLQLAGG